ncbi:MAG: TlyA family RNA methyltransferase, partial [Acidobacteriota bacterium]
PCISDRVWISPDTMARVRVDRLLVERGVSPSREKARRLVLAGEVLVDEVPVEKPGDLVDPESRLRLRGPPSPFVGRGGEKLAGALATFGLDITGLRVLDVGASTGGFTDCLLQRGAAEVTALDVGKGQLDWKLRSHPRVRVVEGVNARYLQAKDFPERFDLVTIDASFISLAKLLPALVPLIREGGVLLALVKPQFELSRKEVERGGVVRDPAKHLKAILSVAEAAKEQGLAIEGMSASPLPGMEGNREFFILAKPGAHRGLDKDATHRLARKVCGLG